MSKIITEGNLSHFIRDATSEHAFDPLPSGRISKGLLMNISILANTINTKHDMARKVMRELKKKIKSGKPSNQILALEIMEGIMVLAPECQTVFGEPKFQRSLTKVSSNTSTHEMIKQAIIALLARYFNKKLFVPQAPSHPQSTQSRLPPPSAPAQPQRFAIPPGTIPHCASKLTSGWEMHKDSNGKYYFYHSASKQTTYWEKRLDRSGRTFYLDHKNQTTSWEDPFSKPNGSASLRKGSTEHVPHKRHSIGSQPAPLKSTPSSPPVVSRSSQQANGEKINLTNVESTIKYIHELLNSIEQNTADESTKQTAQMLVSDLKELQNDIQEKIIKEQNEQKMNRFLQVNDQITTLLSRYKKVLDEANNRPTKKLPPLPVSYPNFDPPVPKQFTSAPPSSNGPKNFVSPQSVANDFNGNNNNSLNQRHSSLNDGPFNTHSLYGEHSFSSPTLFSYNSPNPGPSYNSFDNTSNPSFSNSYSAPPSYNPFAQPEPIVESTYSPFNPYYQNNEIFTFQPSAPPPDV